MASLQLPAKYPQFLALFVGRKGTPRGPSSGEHVRTVVISVKFVQTELMVEICSESVVRAIGKVSLMKFS